MNFSKGELGLALAFVGLGVLWIARAATMPLWDGFAPGSGFMPLWYGVILIGLSGAIAAHLLLSKEQKPEEPVGKPLVVLAVLAATILGLGVAGFSISIFLLLLVLFAVVERLPIAKSIFIAAATTAVLYLVFKTWLGVPLPAGPFGI